MQRHRFTLTIAFSILVYAAIPEVNNNDDKRQVAIKKEDDVAGTSVNDRNGDRRVLKAFSNGTT